MNYCKERLSTDKVFEFCNIFCFHVFISCNTNMLHLLFQKCCACPVAPGSGFGAAFPPQAPQWGWNPAELRFAGLGSCSSEEVKGLHQPPNVTLLFSKGWGHWG